MKLMTQTQVTLDGVMQGNGGATAEDRRNGFERGGWALGAGDAEARRFITETYQRADAFLFGRRTYDPSPRSWGVKTNGAATDRRRIGHKAQVRRIDHDHRPAMGGHDRPLR